MSLCEEYEVHTREFAEEIVIVVEPGMYFLPHRLYVFPYIYNSTLRLRICIYNNKINPYAYPKRLYVWVNTLEAVSKPPVGVIHRPFRPEFRCIYSK